jgi:chromosomal replication initiation ATPase DnaA
MNPNLYIGLPTIVQQMKQLNVPMDVLQLDVNIKGKSLDDILEVVCYVTKISVTKMKAKSRKKEFVQARHLFFYIAKKYTKKDLETIGNHINRHHPVVLHGYKRITNHLIYRDVSWLVSEIENKLINK